MVVFWSNHCYDLFTTTTMELNKIIKYLKILHECKSLLSFPPVNVTKLVLQYWKKAAHNNTFKYLFQDV